MVNLSSRVYLLSVFVSPYSLLGYMGERVAIGSWAWRSN